MISSAGCDCKSGMAFEVFKCPSLLIALYFTLYSRGQKHHGGSLLLIVGRRVNECTSEPKHLIGSFVSQSRRLLHLAVTV
jgi:hypothetical protein